jgi:hypothetical protein
VSRQVDAVAFSFTFKTNSMPELTSFTKELIVQPFQDLIESEGHLWFDNGLPYNVNIFGIRSRTRNYGKFDDFLYCVYRDDWKDWHIDQFRCTTDAGLYYAMNPMNVEGTGILVPSQYVGAYMLDRHNGKYPALCQRLGKVKAYRDDNRDNVMDMDEATIQEGMFGANIHKTTKRQIDNVGKASAMCQVFFSSYEHDKKFIPVLRKSLSIFGNKFTYTLIQD